MCDANRLWFVKNLWNANFKNVYSMIKSLQVFYDNYLDD
jgi:hypothetical protein